MPSNRSILKVTGRLMSQDKKNLYSRILIFLPLTSLSNSNHRIHIYDWELGFQYRSSQIQQAIGKLRLPVQFDTEISVQQKILVRTRLLIKHLRIGISVLLCLTLLSLPPAAAVRWSWLILQGPVLFTGKLGEIKVN